MYPHTSLHVCVPINQTQKGKVLFCFPLFTIRQPPGWLPNDTTSGPDTSQNRPAVPRAPLSWKRHNMTQRIFQFPEIMRVDGSAVHHSLSAAAINQFVLLSVSGGRRWTSLLIKCTQILNPNNLAEVVRGSASHFDEADHEQA